MKTMPVRGLRLLLLTVGAMVLSFYVLSAAAPVNDRANYRTAYANIQAGALPYKDFFLPYPAGFVAVLYLAQLFRVDADSFLSFYLALTALATVWSLTCVAALLGKKLHDPDFVTIAAPIAILYSPFFFSYYDIFPVLITVLALRSLLRGEHAFAFALLGAGALFKYYPLLLALPFGLHLNQKGLSRAKIVILSFFAPLTFVLLSFVGVACLGWQSLTVPAEYLLSRGLHVESVVGAIAGLNLQVPVQAAGAYEVHVSPYLARLPFFLMILGLAAFAVLAWRRPHGEPLIEVARGCLVTVLLLMIPSKLLSPQFLLWCYPFVVLLTGWCGERRLLGTYALALMLTDIFLVEPIYENLLTNGPSRLVPLVIVNLRNLVLLGLTLLTFRPEAVTSPVWRHGTT